MPNITDPIKHVVLLMMENHSFDQMLGSLKEFDLEVGGVDLSKPGLNSDKKGKEFHQIKTSELQMNFDPKHEHIDVLKQLANGNGGFVADFEEAYPSCIDDDKQDIMGYYSLDFLPALHTLAKEFTICDRWFSSLPGPTWPNRFFALTGTSSGEVRMPEGVFKPDLGTFTNQTQTTLFDRLNAVGKFWKIYYYDFPQSLLLVNQRESENLRNYSKIDQFFIDARGPETRFPDFVFIEPQYFGLAQNDDHPPHNTMKAEKLIADVYNALRSNNELWKSTLLIVVYDEHGGFYDHLTPPTTVAPDGHVDQYTFNQLGVRVPALLVSPWVGRRIEHAVFDHTSLLKYLIQKWNLGEDSLGARAAWSNTTSIATALQTTVNENPTRFIRVPNAQLIPPKPDLEKGDSNEHQKGLHSFADYLKAEEDKGLGQTTTALATSAGALTTLKASIGEILSSAAEKLSQGMEEFRKDRLDRTTSVADEMITKAKGLTP